MTADAAAIAVPAKSKSKAPDRAQPAVIEGPGRYVVYEAPDGGWIMARSVGICDTCRGCGCGEQADPVQIPGMVIALARSQGGGLLGKLKSLKGLTGRG